MSAPVIGAKIVYGRDNQRNYGSGRVAYDPPPEGRLSLEDDQLGRLLTRNRISLQNALFRKNCFPYAEWFDVCARANEDWDFAIRLAQHTSIYEDVEPVVLGFISRDSISINRRREIIGLLRILKKKPGCALRSQRTKVANADRHRALFLHSRKAKKRDEISHRRSENLSPPYAVDRLHHGREIIQEPATAARRLIDIKRSDFGKVDSATPSSPADAGGQRPERAAERIADSRSLLRRLRPGS